MRTCVAARLFFALGIIQSVSTSVLVLSEDVEGSGNDLEDPGSGTGDWSGQEAVSKVQLDSEDQASDLAYWPPIDFQSEFTVVGESKSFLETREIMSGLVAGGVTGVILAVLLSALLIHFRRQIKHEGGFILGKQVHKEEVGV